MSVPLADIEMALRLARYSEGAPQPLDRVLAAFGEAAPTAEARRRVAAALDVAGVSAEPPVQDAEPGSLIALTGGTTPPADEGTASPAERGPRRGLPLGLIASGLAALAFVVWIATSGGGNETGERLPTTSPTPTAAAAELTFTVTPNIARLCISDGGAVTFRGRIDRPRSFTGRAPIVFIERGRATVTSGGREVPVRDPPATVVVRGDAVTRQDAITTPCRPPAGP